MKKLYFVLILTIILLACGKKEEKVAEVKDVAKDFKGTKLTMWIMPNSVKSKEDLLEVLKPFTDKTGIEVDVTVLDWGIAWDKLSTSAISGVGPDIVQVGSTWVPTFAAMGALADLRPYFTEKLDDKFLKSSFSTAKLHGKDELVSIPWVADMNLFYYRKDVLEKAGLKPEETFATMDSFKSSLGKIKGQEVDGKKIEAFAYPGKNDWNVVQNIAGYIWSFGGDILSADGKTPMLTDPKSVEGIMYYISLVRDGLVPKYALEKNSSDTEAMIAHGEVAVVQAGPWNVKLIEDSQNGIKEEGTAEDAVPSKMDKVDIAPPMAGPGGRFAFSGSSNLSVFESSKNKEASAQLIRFLTLDVDSQVAYAKKTSLYPPLLAAGETSYIMDSPLRKKVKENMQYGRSFPVVAAWGPIETVVVKNLGVMFDIVTDVDGKYSKERVLEVLKQTEKEMNEVIKQSE